MGDHFPVTPWEETEKTYIAKISLRKISMSYLEIVLFRGYVPYFGTKAGILIIRESTTTQRP